MKKLLPILAVMMLAATGCLREGTEGCPACMNLVFTHAGTTAGFDSRIGNGVELQIYYGGVWHSTRIIPYERIANGRKYSFRKTKSERVQLIAFAVPHGGDERLIPQASEGMRFDEQSVRMADAVRSRAIEQILPKDGDIFVGILDIEEPFEKESTHEVPMRDVMCRVNVILEGAVQFHTMFPASEPSIGLLGTSRSMIVSNGQREATEVEVLSALTEEENNLETPVMRVLPSPDGVETLSVNFFKDRDVLAFPVFETDEIAEADKDITIIYRLSGTTLTITLEIDGWVVRTQTIQL